MHPSFDVNSDAETSQGLEIVNHTDINYSQIGATSQPSPKTNNNVNPPHQFDMNGVSRSNANFERGSASQLDSNINAIISSAPRSNSHEVNAGPRFDLGIEMNTIPQPDVHINIDTNYIPQLVPFEINTVSHFDPNACVSAVFQPDPHADIDMTLVPQLNHFEMGIISPFDPQVGANTLPPFDPYSEITTVTPANLDANFAMDYVPQLNPIEMNNTSSFGPHTGLNGIFQPDPHANINMNYMPSLNHFEMSTIAQSGPIPGMATAAQFQPGIDMRTVSGSNLDVNSDKISNINSNASDSSEIAENQGAILRKIFKMAFQQFSSSSVKLAIIEANLVLSLKPKSKRFLLDSTSLTIGTPAHLVRDLQQPHRFLIGDKILFNTHQKSAVSISGCEDLLWVDIIPRSLTRPAPQAPKKKVEYRVPRPPNAYILYRKDRHREVKAMNPHMDNNDICKLSPAYHYQINADNLLARWLGERWRLETFVIRDHYQKTAADYKEMFMLTYPDYQYRPRKANQRKRRARRTVVSTP
ncbi:Transcription factor SOX-17 [Ceratocystis pirilliformis]|uniref:Transcription factor SOX-17 n=1 Tax=Ceratocystis pirilliformis TaxID=259994 RepID=A0ABR3YHD6_9PEZI